VDLSSYAGRSVELLFEAEQRGDAAALPFAFWARPAAVGERPAGPNVLLVSIDTLRPDHLGCYGYRLRPTSPNLDRLAGEGTRFAQVVAPSPWTTPSHMSLFTSQYPTVHAVDAPIESTQRRLADGKVTLAELLRARGYRTAAFTGAGAISALYGFWQGFDLYDETPRGATGREGEDLPVILERALAWLENVGDRPFFLFLHTYEVHNPYTHETFLEEGGDYDEVERRTRLYDGGIAFADEYLGRLFRELERRGLSDSTLLLVLSDHGEDLVGRYPQGPWYYHGHHLYDELLLVPLLVAGPGVAAGRVVKEQVSLLDVMPTLLELTGTGGPAGQPVQGLSLTPHLDPAGPPEPGEGPGHPLAFAEALNRGPERKALRTPGHKLIWMPSADQSGRSPVHALIPTLELLDLVSDPGETRNLAGAEEGLTRRLFEGLERWWSENRELRRKVAEEEADMDATTREALEALGYL
jgi:arylsulfatase A-like enzyme